MAAAEDALRPGFLLHMCPHTAACVRVLLYVCPHTQLLNLLKMRCAAC
jgi:hypothetical protein